MKKEEVKKLLNLDSTIDIIKIESKDGGIDVHIKSNKKKARCTTCNNFSKNVHDYLKPSKVTYLKNSGLKTNLIIHKRRFECEHCNKSFTEDIGLTLKGDKISIKVKQSILRDFLNRDKTVKEIARSNGVSEAEARNIFLEAMKNYPEVVETLPEVISFDEVSTYTNEGVFSFVLNDPIHRVTLDILPNRNKDFLITYFLKVKNRKSVKVVICDLYTPYYEVVKKCFPNAIFVADQFHYTRYVTKALDDVRIRLVHKYENDKKSEEYKLLKSRISKGLLLKSFNETKAERIKKEIQDNKFRNGRSTKKGVDKFKDYWYGKIKIKKNNKFIEIFRIDRLNDTLDLNQELRTSYELKEGFLRILYNTKYEDVKSELKNWIKECRKSGIKEMIEASNTIGNWLDPICNSFKDDRYSNGFTEANNNTIDKIVDRAYGYKNFKFFRLRTLAILHQSYSGGSRKNIEKGKNKI